MVELSEFKTDTKAINDGVWIRVNEATYGNLEILSRGFTDDFVDAQSARMTKTAEAIGCPRDQIPNSKLREVNATLLEDFLVVDVRNLLTKGEPIPVSDFHAMLYDPAYNKLSRACWDAASKITTRSAAQLENARGNLPRPLESGSNGATSEPN